jgi:hypothetical protein
MITETAQLISNVHHLCPGKSPKIHNRIVMDSENIDINAKYLYGDNSPKVINLYTGSAPVINVNANIKRPNPPKNERGALSRKDRIILTPEVST